MDSNHRSRKTTDLQSVAFDRSATYPYRNNNGGNIVFTIFWVVYYCDWSWWSESNQQPSDYKSDALPLSHTSIKKILPLVPWGGIEPPTRGFSVLCSTDWATKACGFTIKNRNGDLEETRTLDLRRDRAAF